MLRKFKQFISVICIAFSVLFSAWSAPASPKVVTLKVKAEKIVVQKSAKVTTPNFMRTDALVFYESDHSYPRAAVLVYRERLSVKYTGDSEYIYRASERQRQITFIYV